MVDLAVIEGWLNKQYGPYEACFEYEAPHWWFFVQNWNEKPKTHHWRYDHIFVVFEVKVSNRQLELQSSQIVPYHIYTHAKKNSYSHCSRPEWNSISVQLHI